MSEDMYEITDPLSSLVAQLSIEAKAVTTATIRNFTGPLEEFIGHYKKSRLEDRIFLFLGNGNDYISKEEIADFIKSLDGSHKDIIGAMIEKVFHANYDIYVCLYRFIYERYLNNGTLDYYDHTLFSNMEQFTSLDFEVFWYQVNNNQMEISLFDKNLTVEWKINKKVEMDILSIKKFISLGLLQQSDIKTSATPDNNQVHGVISDIRMSMSLEPTGFIMNEYMMSIYKELDIFIDQDTKDRLIEERNYDNDLDEWVV